MNHRKSTWAALGLALAVVCTPSHAIFTNGGFEAGNTTGWTTQFYTTGPLTGAPPFTGANTQLNPVDPASLAYYNNQLDPNWVYVNRGYTWMAYQQFLDEVWNGPQNLKGQMEAKHPSRVKVVGAGFTDPQGAPLVLPRSGSNTLMLNNSSYTYSYDSGGGVMVTDTYAAASSKANTIVQSDTVTAADRDPADGKLHVRFSYAAVLDDAGHAPQDQPYFYLRVRNTTKNTVLFEDFAFASASNPDFHPIPAPTSPFSNFLYKDWTDMDIVVPDADLGDTIEVYLLAADCSQGGHSGYAYLDGFGSRRLPPPGTPDTVAPVPTVGEFGLMGLAMGLGLLGVGRLRAARRR
jgi:hypothetical protein